MDKVYRVFFHELGHYLAREINHRHYEGPRVIEIHIHPCKNNPEEYCGGAVPQKPVDFKPERRIPFHRLPSYLASLVYGCMLQCYYNKESLEECFKIHGCEDSKQFYATLRSWNDAIPSDEFEQIFNNYFNLLIEQNSMDELILFNPEKYLIGKENNCYIVNLELLHEDLNNFKEKHYPIYQSFVETIKKKLDSGL